MCEIGLRVIDSVLAEKVLSFSRWRKAEYTRVYFWHVKMALVNGPFNKHDRITGFLQHGTKSFPYKTRVGKVSKKWASQVSWWFSFLFSEELKFEPITAETLRVEKGFLKAMKKQQKEIELMRKRQLGKAENWSAKGAYHKAIYKLKLDVVIKCPTFRYWIINTVSELMNSKSFLDSFSSNGLVAAVWNGVASVSRGVNEMEVGVGILEDSVMIPNPIIAVSDSCPCL